jgi:hypothetical protein
MEKLEKKYVAWYILVDQILAGNSNRDQSFVKKLERN